MLIAVEADRLAQVDLKSMSIFCPKCNGKASWSTVHTMFNCSKCGRGWSWLKRSELEDQIRVLPHGDPEVQRLGRLLAQAICRACPKQYNINQSRADLQGFCSMKCQHAKAKACGWTKKGIQNEYSCLKNAKCIGTQFVIT